MNPLRLELTPRSWDWNCFALSGQIWAMVSRPGQSRLTTLDSDDVMHCSAWIAMPSVPESMIE